MTIFNIELFGSDADWFCSLSKLEQFAWVKNNTNQVDDDLINEFLATCSNKKAEYCIPCRNNKQKVSIAKIVEDGNISKGNEQEVTTIVEPIKTESVRRNRNKKK
jgi:NADH:ubiquinone oxidoreductase subunit F (NADH-binding)